jgi:hypothetical protein
MRREIVATVVSGLVLGGITAIPAFAAEHGADKVIGSVKAQSAAHAKAKTFYAQTSTSKTVPWKKVIFHGLELKVPSGWAIVRLDQHPSTCVSYAANAVYLGTPGANMQCQAGLVGRADTVNIIPSTTVAAGSGSEITDQRNQPDGAGGTRTGSVAALHVAIRQDTSQHELRVVLGAAALGLTVLGTYGADPAVIRQVLTTMSLAPKGAAETAQSGFPRPLPGLSRVREPAISQRAAALIAAARATATGLRAKFTAARRLQMAITASTPESTGWRGLPPDWPIEIVRGTTPPPRFRQQNGFDACTAPSLAAMQAWRSRYTVAGVYIGGVNMGCPYGNLSASWVKAVIGQGWGLLPTYVGPQAPCWGVSGTTINPGRAAAEGRTDGLAAVHDARYFGFGAGSPIYYDMESYQAFAPSCVSAVLTFLGAWDRTVSAAGYRTAVYSSQDSGIADMQAATLAKTPGFTAPDGIWIALWDGKPSLIDGTLAWRLPDRVKQYSGNLHTAIGGFWLWIDQDVVGGPIAQ